MEKKHTRRALLAQKCRKRKKKRKERKSNPRRDFFFFTRRFKNNIFKIIFSQVLEIEIVVTTKKRFMFSMMM